MATKPCENCGYEINQAAVGCQNCGAKWSEDGEYRGVPAAFAAEVASASVPTRVADMTPGDLRATVFWMVFFALLAAGFVAFVISLLLQLLVVAS